jgi:3-deoxy-D-manno-octulosonic-acid transferase
MFFLYTIFIRLYPFVISLASPFIPKAKLWAEGRNRVFERMGETIDSANPLIWMHCSSLGEFEQGRPLIEKIRDGYPGYKILLTFFSPSGFEVRKNYSGADYIFYLPMDSRKNAFQFIETAKPSLILFIKYDFWYYYLNEAKKRNIPLLLISGIFRKSQPFFSRFGHFHRSLLSCFTHFFVQNIDSSSLLENIGFEKNVTISGDTRFDRVIEIAEQFKPIPAIEAFCTGSDVIVAGSTWGKDDIILSGYTNTKSNIKCIIAPHEISKQRLNDCLKWYKNPALFSAISAVGVPPEVETIIIDNIGMLSRLYKYATITYVGGGFDPEGVHNVLEAAVYGKPVVFGPVYNKFLEAKELIGAGGGITVKDAASLQNTLNRLFRKDEKYTETCKAALDYVYSKKGATEKILRFIQEKRLLTS